MNNDLLFESKHFELKELGDGVYAAMVTSNGGGFANSGIIDIGGKTVIFDTFNTPQAAEDLRKAAEKLIINSEIVVINSHWHGDHIRGNQVFKDCEIFASKKTKELMDEIQPKTMQELKDGIDQFPGYYKHFEEQLKNDIDEATRKELEDTIQQYKELEASIPNTFYVGPTITFENHLVLEGTKRKIELQTFGGGHTKCDAFLLIPDCGVLFSADIVLVDLHLYLTDGNAKEWVRILEQIENLSFETVVPGHGAIGTREHVVAVKEYLLDIMNLAANEEDLEKIAIPEKYQSWGFAELFNISVGFLKNALTTK